MSAAADGAPTALRRQVARAIRWNALIPVKIAASALVRILLTNRLAADDIGIYLLVTALAGFLGTWIDLGVERSLPKFYPEIDRQAGRAGLRRFVRWLAWFKLAVVALLVAVLLISHPWFFAWWGSRASTPTVQAQLADQGWWLFASLVALLIFGAIFDILMQVLIAFFRQKQFNLITLIVAIVQPLLLAVVVMSGLGLLGILAVLVAVPIIAMALAWPAARAALTDRGGSTDQAVVGPEQHAGLPPSFYRRLAVYSLTNFGQQIATMAHSAQFAVIFFASTFGNVAIFSNGHLVAGQALQIVFSPLNGLLVPLFARLREEGTPADTNSAYGVISRFKLLLFLPAAAGLAVLAPNLTLILWPAQFAEAAPVTAVMAISLFGSSLLATARNVLMVHERYRPIIAGRLIGLLAIPLLVWLTPRYGPVGMAVAIGSASLAAELTAWLGALRILRLDYPWSFAGRVLMATAAMVAVIWPLVTWWLPVSTDLTPLQRFGPALIGQLAVAALGALVYLLTVRALGGLTAADKEALRSLRLPGARYLLRLL